MKRSVVKTVARTLIDFGVAAVSLPMAMLLKSNGQMPDLPLPTLGILVGSVGFFKSLVYASLGGLTRIWRYTSLREGLVLGMVTGLSAGTLATLRITGLFPLSLSVIAIDAALFLLGVAGVRVLRLLQVARRHARNNGASVRTLIVGAGDTANSLVDDMKSLQGGSWIIVGLLDDNRSKLGQTLLRRSVWRLSRRPTRYAAMCSTSAVPR